MADKTLAWSKSALRQFDQAINYIAYDSPQNAEKVKQNILRKAQGIIAHPEINPLDKYKVNNDGS